MGAKQYKLDGRDMCYNREGFRATDLSELKGGRAWTISFSAIASGSVNPNLSLCILGGGTCQWYSDTWASEWNQQVGYWQRRVGRICTKSKKWPYILGVPWGQPSMLTPHYVWCDVDSANWLTGDPDQSEVSRRRQGNKRWQMAPVPLAYRLARGC